MAADRAKALILSGSAFDASDDIAAGRLVHLLAPWRGAPAPVHIAYPYARFSPAKLRLFVGSDGHGISDLVKGKNLAKKARIARGMAIGDNRSLPRLPE